MTTSQDIRELAFTRPRVDTHSHLAADPLDLRDLTARCWQPLKTLSGVRALAVGCRELHGVDVGAWLRPEAPDAVFAAAASLRARGASAAYEEAFRQAKIEVQLAFTAQLHFQDHTPENCPLPAVSPRIRLLAFIDSLVCGDDRPFCPEWPTPGFCYYDALCRRLGPLDSLDDYLARLDETIDRWKGLGVVGLKSALAYSIGLAVGDPPMAGAARAFARKREMTPGEVRTVQDAAQHRILQAAARTGLPLVIHTGFLIWGRSPLSQSNPALLYPLLSDPRYRGVTFVLLHGGMPYIGETSYLAVTFPHVVINFTWLANLSPTRFRSALSEWLELLPGSRMCWGSDSCVPEDIVGIDRIVRGLIADVLEGQMARGQLDARAAREFIDDAYWSTARRVFGV